MFIKGMILHDSILTKLCVAQKVDISFFKLIFKLQVGKKINNLN